ncbi:phage portal protein [uncultured Winogradskyella sp.]|uniref:phage portal protein n=1 Tax=uncultured Winogradskyella sp. TaxID=395353 RepID=UPI002607BBD0|nr:phage portal protein [uncultured Winogradskyella sp.]
MANRLKKWYDKQMLKTIDKASLPINNQSLSFLPPTTFINKGTPVWQNFSELRYLLNCYYENPVVNAVINIKAEAFANMRFKVKDLKSEEIIPLEQYDADGGKLKKLLIKPNPLQTGSEWLRQLKVNYEVFGNGYIYGMVPVGWESNFTYEDIQVLNNLPPYCVSPVLTGNWLTATTKSDIIRKYVLKNFNSKHKDLDPNLVMHFNNVNIKFDNEFTQGKSDLLALTKPITNIKKAFEARNVLIERRGPQGAWTSDLKDDAMGSIPLTNNQIEDVQKAFSKYGLMEDQYTQIISNMPLKFHKTGFNTKELLLFEEVESDAIAIANAKGVPELLAKYYTKGGTFENLNASEKRLYDSTIIPETDDFMQNFNHFFKTSELGIELLATYDHLNILQANKKEEAQTTEKHSQTAERAFRSGAINYNSYLTAIGLPHNETIGEMHIWDLSAEQLNAINIKTEIAQNE